MREALDIEVHGIVQGVGFRPFVYKLAKRHLIDGWVLNATAGVFIHAEGEAKDIDDFVLDISENAPAAARVDEILMKEAPLADFTTFSIRESDDGWADATTLVSPDLATCDECVAELFDPADRRYHYPFINCTNCGPRFTIIDSLPYDRPATSMAGFAMCDACEAEYRDPGNRRFHAQPNACFECGPHISWWEPGMDALRWGSSREESDKIIERAAEALRDGRIVAVKGLGGFHLACDAENEAAIAELRRRKRREGKAFAVMMRAEDDVRAVCEVSDAEARLLASPQRPIVLLRKRADARIAAGLADRLPELGVMLPATPVQHLLLAAFGGPLVMTSGNLHDEPIQTDDDEARRALAGVADAFLGNNRPIRSRFDDSVVRVIAAGSAGDAVQTVRRARGYAPLPVPLAGEGATHPDGSPRVVLACGPQQKNTFCLLRGEQAFVSQHIGDMENAETFDAWLAAMARYERLFDAKPEALACDEHPEYLATKWAERQREQSAAAGAPLRVEAVQHHHAHVASVMAENGLVDATIGVAFDGTGYRADGCIWGGEVLLANRLDYERFANFAYVPMPGGAAAVKNPARMAYGVLWQFDLLEHPAARPLLDELGEAAAVCDRMIERGVNCPLTSSVGRLFDAASALLGVCERAGYEGEPAVLLEAAIGDATLGWPSGTFGGASGSGRETSGDGPNEPEGDAGPGAACEAAPVYHVGILKNTASADSTAHDTSVALLDAEPVFRGMLDSMASGVSAAAIARAFHDAMAEAIVQACLLANAAYGISTVALAGGVFMNRYLTERSIAALEGAGFTVALSKELPPNDGGISYGQAAVAAARMAAEEGGGAKDDEGAERGANDR